MATILIISSIVKRSLWRASPPAGGGAADFIQACHLPPWRRRCEHYGRTDRQTDATKRISTVIFAGGGAKINWWNDNTQNSRAWAELMWSEETAHGWFHDRTSAAGN